jgi:aminopeptidase 2
MLHSTSTFNQSLQQGLDSIRSKAGWLRRDTADVEGWLTKAGYLKSGKAKS